MTPRNVHLLGLDWRRRLKTFGDAEYFQETLRHEILAATSPEKGSYLQRNRYKNIAGDDMPRAMFAFPTIDGILHAAAIFAFLMASPIGEHVWGVSVERRVKGPGYVVFLKCDEKHIVDVVETAVDLLDYTSEFPSIPIFGKNNRKLSSVDVRRSMSSLFLDD